MDKIKDTVTDAVNTVSGAVTGEKHHHSKHPHHEHHMKAEDHPPGVRDAHPGAPDAINDGKVHSPVNEKDVITMPHIDDTTGDMEPTNSAVTSPTAQTSGTTGSISAIQGGSGASNTNV